MDYMLLKDGSFIPIPGEPASDHIRKLLLRHDGVAHYWLNPPNYWYHITPSTSLKSGGLRIDAHDVPEIIRLAAMLE